MRTVHGGTQGKNSQFNVWGKRTRRTGEKGGCFTGGRGKDSGEDVKGEANMFAADPRRPLERRRKKRRGRAKRVNALLKKIPSRPKGGRRDGQKKASP